MRPVTDIFKTLNFFSESTLREEIIQNCQLLVFAKGETLIREGQYVKVVPIVISGKIRVFQSSEDREILLYYVEQAQTCIMSLSASYYDKKSPAQAVTETTTEVLAIPIHCVTEWQRRFVSWNEFIIRAFRNRYDELLDAFKSVAFDQTNKRVWEYLKSTATRQQSNKLEISHLGLANQLGTTRVVVSRILKQFELENKVSLTRGAIELLQ